jgi:hypothetical protein
MAAWDEEGGDIGLSNRDRARIETARRLARVSAAAYKDIKANRPNFRPADVWGSVLAAWLQSRPQFAQQANMPEWRNLIHDPSTDLARLVFVMTGLDENMDLNSLSEGLGDAMIRVIKQEITSQIGHVP